MKRQTFLLLLLVTLVCVPLASCASWHDAETWSVKLVTPVVSTYIYSYTLRGPYLESGVIYNGFVAATLYYGNSSSASFLFNGTGGIEQSYALSSNVSATFLIWNITADYNHSRIYTFRSTEYTVDYKLHVPDTTETVGQYSIIIANIAGVTNIMVETDCNVGGTMETIERQQYAEFNAMGFYLIMFHHYTLKAVADQGTYTWDLVADGYSPKTFNITSSSVTNTNNITLRATRLTETSLNVYYYDANHTTSWVQSNVQILNTSGYYSFYLQNDTGYSQNYTLTTLTATTSYVVAFTANVNDTLLNWQLEAFASNSTNYWAGKFDMLGDFPFALENAVGATICLAFIALGSWSDTEWFLVAGILLAAFFTAIGWLTIPYAGITGALMVVVFMYFYKGKQNMRM